MARPTSSEPTERELAILRTLWQRGPSTVREVYEALPDPGGGYTAVLRIMQVMLGKGLLTRDASDRSHVYEAARSKEDTQRQMVKGVLERVFGGSARDLVAGALAAKKASPEELRKIRALLDEAEQE